MFDTQQQPINIDTVAPDAPGINIDTGTGPKAPVSSETAATRALKVHFGLAGVLGKDYPDIYSSILNGQEGQLRTEASTAFDVKNAQIRQQQISALAGKGMLDDATFKNLQLKPVNPDSVFEESFAHTWMGSLQTAALNMGDTFLKDAQREVPQTVQDTSALGSETIAKNELLNTAIQNATDAGQNESTGRYLWNTVKSFVPGYDEYRLRGNTPNVGFASGGLLGENLERQAQDLAVMPLEQYKENLTRVMDSLKDNPDLQMSFLQALRGYSTSDKMLQDTFSAVNIATIPGLTAIPKILSTVGLINATRQATKDVVESAFKSDLPRTGIIPPSRALVVTSNMPMRAIAAEGAGDIKSAAIERVTANLEDDLKGKANPTVRAIETITSNFRMDQDALATNPGNLSRQEVLRIQTQYETNLGNILDTIQKTMRTMRVNLQQASRATVQTIQEQIKDKYPGLSNRILDLTNPIHEPVSNTWHMGMNIGDVDGLLFSSEKRATIAARMQDLISPEIRQQGLGYYIRVYKPLDEQSDVMRDFLVSTGFSKSPGGWKNAALGWFRSPEDTMSRQEMQARKAATYPQAKFRELADKEAQYIRDLAQGKVRNDPITGAPISRTSMLVRSWAGKLKTRKSWQEWKRVLEAARDELDIKGQPGRTFTTPGDYSDFFMRVTGRLPTYQETEAYFAKNRLDLYDHMLRNMEVYKYKARLGTETNRIFAADSEGKPTYSNYFDGISMNHLPGGNSGILVSEGIHGGERIFNSASEIGADYKSDLESRIMTGQLKVYEIYAPEYRPFSGYGKVGDQRIRYVIAKNAETHPLSWDQVPRRGGGHFDYDYDHYIKQAIIRKSGSEHWYEGDQTIMPMAIRSMGVNIAKHLNEVRLLLKDSKEEEARLYANEHLPMKWDDLRKWFMETRSEDGKVHAPWLDLNEPIQVINKDQLIGNVDKNGLEKRYNIGDSRLRNGLREGSKNSQFQVMYTGERDSRGLFTVEDKGTRNNPMYQYKPAEFVDPVTSMNNGLNRIIHSTFMNDYKIYAIEHWLREAEGHLIDSIPEIRSAPYWYFSKAPVAFNKDVDPHIKANLMSNWYKIQQFLGQPSAFDVWLHRAEQALSDVTYDTFGPKVAMVPTWALHRIKDPVQFIRKMTYHAKLGLFNPAQWLVQNQTWTNIWAISPKSAPAGTVATLLHQWSRFNKDPAILDKLDTYASKLGWKPGEWREAMEHLDRTGFSNVEGEYALLDSPMSHKFIKNDMSTFLDLGQTFFKEGVRNVRLGAWYTAFKEYRNLHPTGAINETDLQAILDKADMYHANMSRASSSLLNRGVFSLPFQFLTYQMRLAEMFMGKRLGETTQERALARMRLVGFYTGLYGVPAAMGLTGLPLGDYFRQSAQDNGYVVGDKWYSTMSMEGLPQMALAAVTGSGDFHKGLQLNIGDRFGSHGFDALREALRSDEPWWGILGGAAFNTAIPFMEGATHLLWGMANADYHVTLSDWLQPFKEITSIDQGWKTFIGATLHEWMSKNEGVIKSNVSTAEAVLMGLSGTQPQEEDDIFTKGNIIKSRQAYDKNNLKSYISYMERGMHAAASKDYDLATKNFNNAYIYLQLLPLNSRNSALAQAGKAIQTLPERVDWDFYIKTAPPDKRLQLLQAYQNAFRLRQEREQH